MKAMLKRAKHRRRQFNRRALLSPPAINRRALLSPPAINRRALLSPPAINRRALLSPPAINRRALLSPPAINMPRNTLRVESSVIFRRVSGDLNLAVGFNPRDSRRVVPASRQRRMNSIVADATRKQNLAHRGLKPTAKFKCRYAAESVKALLSWVMVIGLCVSFSIGGFGQDLEAARQFVQSANSSNAAQKLLREGRELVGERKWSAATTKFNDLIRAYPRDKNLDAALYW